MLIFVAYKNGLFTQTTSFYNQTVMGDFYLTLPSNSSSSQYPDNHGGHFYTKLSENFDLSRQPYEVGLAEIQFSNTHSNVKEGEAKFSFTLDGALWINIRITEGFYHQPTSLVNAMNQGMRVKVKHAIKPKFHYNRESKKVWIKLYNKKQIIRLNSFLAKLFSMPEMMQGPNFFQSDDIVNLHENSTAIYVYCDLVAHRPVGDIKAPLLRTVPIKDPSNDIVHVVYEKPHYIPIGRHQFDTLELLLCTDSGEITSFKSGKTVITLHLRPRRYV